MAAEHWREHCPTMYAELTAEGELEEALRWAARRTAEALRRAQSEGLPYDEAWHAVKGLWILLPDEDNSGLNQRSDRTSGDRHSQWTAVDLVELEMAGFVGAPSVDDVARDYFDSKASSKLALRRWLMFWVRNRLCGLFLLVAASIICVVVPLRVCKMFGLGEGLAAAACVSSFWLLVWVLSRSSRLNALGRRYVDDEDSMRKEHRAAQDRAEWLEHLVTWKTPNKS